MRSSNPSWNATWRPARRDDDDAIVEMCAALYREDPGLRDVPASQVRATLAALRDEPRRGRAVVLAAGEERAGYALLIPFWSNEYGGEICNLDELYVCPPHRGRGHARSLLEAIAAGREPWPRRPAALELEVDPANARARALYERLGFRAIQNATMRWTLG